MVTGAASGLGLVTSQMLAERGHSVAMLDLNGDRLDEEAGRLGEAGHDVHPFQIDLRDSAAVASTVERVAEMQGLCAVANVAGLGGLGTLASTDEADWDLTVDTKLKGMYLVCRAVMPHLAGVPGAAIVNVASMSGRTKSLMATPSYSAANGGIIGLTMTVAAQSAALGVRVNCVAPGLFKSPLTMDMYRTVVGPEKFDAIPASIPLGRFAETAEIAEVVLFLLSDKASYITGETINVNGGMFMV